MRAVICSIMLWLIVATVPASASVYDIDLMTLIGPPGSWSPYAFLQGPCYCAGPGFISQIYPVMPGDTVDFGMVEIFPIVAGGHSNGQPLYTVLTLGVAVSFDPMHPAAYAPAGELGNSPLLFDLVYTIPEGAETIQVGWRGPYIYDSPLPPVPEPSTWAMLMIGFAAIGFTSRFRTRGLAGWGNGG